MITTRKESDIMKKQLKKKVGRPKSKNPKIIKNVCISRDVLAWYRSKGEGSLSKGLDFVARRFMPSKEE